MYRAIVLASVAQYRLDRYTSQDYVIQSAHSSSAADAVHTIGTYMILFRSLRRNLTAVYSTHVYDDRNRE